MGTTPTKTGGRTKTSEGFRAWLPLLSGLFGVALTAVAFIYRDVYLPATAPINLTTEVKVQEAGVGATGVDGRPLEAIEIKISARNPSSRKVYLLKNLWQAVGVHIKSIPEDDSWLDHADARIGAGYLLAGSRHHTSETATLVAAGNAFADTMLNPNETISAAVVIYLPKGTYDFLQIDTFLPTVAKEDPKRPGEGLVNVRYVPAEDRSGFKAELYRLNDKGEEEDFAADEAGSYTVARSLGFGIFTSTSQLSLWGSVASSPPQETSSE
jgi:hypothetical protein